MRGFYIGLTDKMIVQMERAVVYLAEDANGRGKSVEIVKKNGYNWYRAQKTSLREQAARPPARTVFLEWNE